MDEALIRSVLQSALREEKALLVEEDRLRREQEERRLTAQRQKAEALETYVACVHVMHGWLGCLRVVHRLIECFEIDCP